MNQHYEVCELKKKQNENLFEIKCLRNMAGVTRRDIVKNEVMRRKQACK